MTSIRAEKEIAILAWPSGAPGEENPYTRMIYSACRPPAARVIRFSPLMLRVPGADVFHLHWPEGIFEGRLGASRIGAHLKARRVLRTAALIRRRGGLVVLTAHNLEPHAKLDGWQRALYADFHRSLLATTDLLVGLSAISLAKYAVRYPEAAGISQAVVSHPHYRDSYPPAPSRVAARAALGLRGNLIIGMIGSIRRSKQIPAAIAAFRTAAREDEILYITGACGSDELWEELLRARDGDHRVHIRRGRLNDEELVASMSAVDICLLNQANTLNSGTALLALSFDRPLVAPAVGALPELQTFVGDEWMQLVPTPLTATDLRKAVDQLRAKSRVDRAPLDALDPLHLSERLLQVIRRRIVQA